MMCVQSVCVYMYNSVRNMETIERAAPLMMPTHRATNVHVSYCSIQLVIYLSIYYMCFT